MYANEFYLYHIVQICEATEF